MPNERPRPVPRILQQQPSRESDEEQQRSGQTDFQSRGAADDRPDETDEADRAGRSPEDGDR